jgi:hypothetical protein
VDLLIVAPCVAEKAQIVLADGSGVLHERVVADCSLLSLCYKGGLFVELFYVTEHMMTRH